jgi:hypothetical protein
MFGLDRVLVRQLGPVGTGTADSRVSLLTTHSGREVVVA